MAYRRYDDATTTDAERDAILEAMIEAMPDGEAEAAAVILHHRRAARAHQLQLSGLLNPQRPAA